MRVVVGILWILITLGTANGQQQGLLLQHSWWDTGADSHSDCVQVESDGSYRFEHTPIHMGQPDHGQIHTGKLSDDEMKQLRQRLMIRRSSHWPRQTQARQEWREPM